MSDEIENLVSKIDEMNTEVAPEVPTSDGETAPGPDDVDKSPLDDLGMDEPIFSGGPTRAEVEEWKKKFPSAQVMATLLADGTGIVWRTFNRLEWRGVQNQIKNIPDTDRRDDMIFSKITLFPNCSDVTVVGNLPAGAVNTVMNEFYIYSGFQPVAESLRL